MSTHNIPFSISKTRSTLNHPKSAAMGFCYKGLKNEFEIAVVKEPSVFEPLKFYCNQYYDEVNGSFVKYRIILVLSAVQFFQNSNC